ncbi:hypothetical protein A4G26_17945 [Mycobacterium kansasii]|nr:hypothetical protein A4G26_17945 [Mycobacterium kansasii]
MAALRRWRTQATRRVAGPGARTRCPRAFYPALQYTFDALYPKGLQWYWLGDFFRTIADGAVQAHARFTEDLPTMHSTMHLYPVDGAVHRVGQTDTAWAYRDVNFSQVIAGVDPDPANAAALKRWTVDYWDATHPYSAAGAYVDFMMDEGQHRVRATYGPNYHGSARSRRHTTRTTCSISTRTSCRRDDRYRMGYVQPRACGTM